MPKCHQDIRDKYELGKVLGSGSFGQAGRRRRAFGFGVLGFRVLVLPAYTPSPCLKRVLVCLDECCSQ